MHAAPEITGALFGSPYKKDCHLIGYVYGVIIYADPIQDPLKMPRRFMPNLSRGVGILSMIRAVVIVTTVHNNHLT